ncbi:permease [Xylanibacillus composti]|uniref:Permease n=1 Tax=Xylanibacillus composti TaxID=1572762 RepID=A0A8J4M1J0_9BACL|nr:permease [Xylanibacillus composti]MDT9726254.1 permease [Xylanibacillus composti]GIQ68105.1 permease [Xylanibacillus composti]
MAFKTIFISIILEALPFILLGVLLSSFLHVFVSADTIRKWTPRNPWLGIPFACLLGIVFPLCECGMIPVVRRLIRQGMPLYIGITYLLAGPILNPVVFASTYMAFRAQPEMVYSRMALGFLSAAFIGWVVYRFVTGIPLKSSEAHAGDHHHAHHHEHAATEQSVDKPGWPLFSLKRWGSVISHASDEFFEMGKYLLLGAFLTAGIQTVLDRNILAAVAENSWAAHLFMAGFAYLLSICSTSDAFIATSFQGIFGAGPLLTFMVFGPMLDFKNTLMFMAAFRIRFVLLLLVLITITTISFTILWEHWMLDWMRQWLAIR